MARDTKTVVSRLSPELYDRLQKLAEEQDRSISSMIVRLVAIATGDAKPEPVSPAATQVNMPTTDAERAEMMERMR